MSSTPTSDLENDSADATPGSPNNSPLATTGSDHVSIAAQIGERATIVNIGQDIIQTNIEGNVYTDGGNFIGRDKTIDGDEVQGDKIGRDKVTIGAFISNLWPATTEITQLLRARKILLENVNKFWVEGVLKYSLHNEVLLTLGLEEKPSAVDNRPWDTVLQIPQQPDRPLPHGMKIIDVFDQQQQHLLILGAPGAGKTTMLLELARDLITRAQQDISHPIPVVLNLSSWAMQRQPLADWIGAELNSKYYITPKIAQAWVENDALLLLLDGLDEVQKQHRDHCVDAINTFRKTHIVALAVCSRITDYAALEQPLQLQGAVLIQPLRQDQVDAYWERLGAEYTAVCTVLQNDTGLQELAESPLILSIMTLAYRGIDIETLARQTTERAHRQHLFDTYTIRMFSHRMPVQVYLPQQTLHWLTWLATNMVQRQQTIFLIERLQPDWLQVRLHIWLYRFIVGLCGLFFGALFGLLIWRSSELTFGLNRGLIFGLNIWLILALILGLTTSLGIGLILGWRTIKPTERIVFSWRIGKKKLYFWVILGLLIGLLFGVIFGQFAGLLIGILVGLFSGALGGLLIGLFSGLFKEDEVVQHSQPNQGIWQSARNMWFGGSLFGLLFGLLGVLLFGLSSRLLFGPSTEIRGGLFFGLLFGSSAGLIIGQLIYGGCACIQHIILRGLLTLYHYAPLNYTSFLDYCADRIFLHKVGGGYIFIHRLMMEHFAELTEEDIKRLASSMDGR